MAAHSIGLSYPNTLNSKQTDGISLVIEPTSTLAWPTTTAFADDYTPFGNPIHHTNYTRSRCSVRDLTKHTRASYDTARKLRSGQYTDLEVYAIRRMATSLEEPGRSRAIHILNEALKYRNLTPPKSNLPLTIPFLAC